MKYLSLSLFIAVVVSIIFASYFLQSRVELCVVGFEQERYEKTAEFLSGVLDLSLALSTGLVSLGAALLIGLHTGITLTLRGIIILLMSLVAFAESAAYGIFWKIQLANIWFNECYNQIASPHVQDVYQAHFILLMVGILLVSVLIVNISFDRVIGNGNGGSDE